MNPTMHDLLAAYPDILAERRELTRTRPVPFRPVPFRPLPPEHGHYAARLCVPTRRARFLAWWRGRRQWQRDALLTALFLAGFLALGLTISVGLALVDRVAQ